MKKIIHLRINYDYYHLLFGKSEGRDLGTSIKVVELSEDDPRLEQIPIIDRELQEKHNTKFFFGWDIKRRYTSRELSEAKLFQLIIKRFFEPAGEECGTQYKDFICDICGVDRIQKGFLHLKRSSIPKTDISQTIAGEIVVSEKFVLALKKWNVKGFVGGSIIFKKDLTTDYYQFNTAKTIDLSNKTIAGANLFDLSHSSESSGITLSNGMHVGGGKEIYKCPRCNRIGLNLLSEVYVKNDPVLEQYDLFSSKQRIGVFRGMLQPRPVYVCSPLFKEMVEKEKLTGFGFEVAYIE